MRVHPAQLSTAATSVHTTRADLKAELHAAHTTMESALDGWTGGSAAALTARLGSWQQRADAIDRDLIRYADALSTTARRVDEVDATNARNLDF